MEKAYQICRFDNLEKKLICGEKMETIEFEFSNILLKIDLNQAFRRLFFALTRFFKLLASLFVELQTIWTMLTSATSEWGSRFFAWKMMENQVYVDKRDAYYDALYIYIYIYLYYILLEEERDEVELFPTSFNGRLFFVSEGFQCRLKSTNNEKIFYLGWIMCDWVHKGCREYEWNSEYVCKLIQLLHDTSKKLLIRI
jgi:hypothetical protein